MVVVPVGLLHCLVLCFAWIVAITATELEDGPPLAGPQPTAAPGQTAAAGKCFVCELQLFLTCHCICRDA